jgi:hypothetical protein
MVIDDLDQSLAKRRDRRDHRQLPKRFRDMLPEPPAALPIPPPYLNLPVMLPPTAKTSSAAPVVQASRTILSRVRKILKSPRNIFGLFRQYHATHFPEHDPEENVAVDDLMDITPDTLSSPTDTYHPYPNQSSFLLGEWYWNDGAQKSQSSFNNLLGIIGHPEFQPEDVAGTNWRHINTQLGGGNLQDLRPNDDDAEDGWEDEVIEGDWVNTPIKIKVPFHKRTLHPGQEEFTAGTLRHRKLVSVIREKISSPSSHPHLHFEPYELYWQPQETTEPMRVHGELYSSEAFIDAHQKLQDSPREPGCDLPRVVVGLMFGSDATHLTAFSDAKLSPVYLGFGNESKNRRSKPSCQALEHVAYFETVSTSFSPFRLQGD